MSESVFDKPLNGDLEALSSSVVKSINGKKPDPITGDITVIEGGGSGSYGAYRLDTTIPVSAWSGSGPYTVTVVNELIKSTMDGKSWLDNGTALLGKTTLTSQDGSLLISTTVKPTEAWVLHVSFALNGADVLADSEEQKKAIGKILPVITGTTNNSGYTINAGDYFEANGNLYKASATIPTNESWSSSSDALTTSALSDIHAKIGDVGSTSLQSQVTTLNNKVGNVGSTDLQSQVTTLNSKIANKIKVSSVLTTDNIPTGGATPWTNFESDDLFCLPVITQGSVNSAMLAVGAQRGAWRILNSASSEQKASYVLIHFKKP